MGPYHEMMLIFPGLVIVLFLTIIGIRWIRASNTDAIVLIAYPFLYYIVMTAQNAPVFFSWYYLPLMPGLLILFFGAFLHLIQFPPFHTLINHQVELISLLGCLLVGIPALLMQVLPGWADTRVIEASFRQSCTLVHNQIQPGQIVLAPDIGVIGWELDTATILDPIGLVSPISLKYMSPGKEMGLVTEEMIKERQPDYIIAREDFIQNFIHNPNFLDRYQLIQPESNSAIIASKVLIYKRNW